MRIFLIYVWWCRIRLLDSCDSWRRCILTFSLVQRYIQIKFFSEFVAAPVVISIAVASSKIGLATNQNIITIASVMPLVPGILITNAIRDLLAGELLAGMSRGVGAALTAFAIGAGVAIVLLIFKRGCSYCYFIYFTLQSVSFPQSYSPSFLMRLVDYC